jgi:hypothetical protein
MSLIDGLNHKDDCLPSMRTTEVISPVTGMRCRNCGAEKDKYKDMIKLLKHCKMYIVDGEGYCGNEYEEVKILKKEFERLGI